VIRLGFRVGFFANFFFAVLEGSEVVSLTTRKAASLTSSVLRFAMPHNGTSTQAIQWCSKTKLYHYPPATQVDGRAEWMR
jgi:hypothetical protein